MESAGQVPFVLEADCRVRDSIPEDYWKVPEIRGQSRLMVYSRPYTLLFNELLGNLMENRMRLAIQRLGSLWFTAWVEAGQPPLHTDFMPPQGQTPMNVSEGSDQAQSETHRCSEGN